jgi:hypothetical protein
MKTKQLANVLIKILGLSICIYAIPSFVLGILVMLSDSDGSTRNITVWGISVNVVSAAVQVVVGIVIISLSQKIAGLMFKSDEE